MSEEGDSGDEDQVLGKVVMEVITQMRSNSARKMGKRIDRKEGGRRKIEIKSPIEVFPQ